jgi:alpha-D-xyloside xylohydrolase
VALRKEQIVFGIRRRCLVLVFTLVAVATAACATRGALLAWDQSGGRITLRSDTGARLVIEAWGDRIVRVTRLPPDAVRPTSLGVIATPAAVDVRVTETRDAIELVTPALRVRVDRASEAVAFLDAAGRSIVAEIASAEPDPPDATTPPAAARQSFTLGDDEAIFGLGQHADGQWNHRGQVLRLQQRNGHIAVPVLVSSRGYAVLWDNASVTDVAVAAPAFPDRVTWRSERGDAIDYYVVVGPSLDDVVRGLRTLGGAAPLWPRWALGYWQSRERYTSQDQLLEVASEYRRRRIPIDAVVLDWLYWLPHPWGSHRFGDGFPDPAAMNRSLQEMNLHCVISVWPKFERGSDHHAALASGGLLFPTTFPHVFPPGEGQWYDAFNPEAQRVYWQQIATQLLPLGFDGWWLDATEPELGGQWGEMRAVTTAAGPGDRVYNAYPLLATKAVHDGLRRDAPDRRAVIVTRSAWFAQQRHAAAALSGDIGGDWRTLQRQIPAALNLSLTGIAYWGSDIGGFYGRPTDDPDYRELFVRWFQFGAFTPLFRVHGSLHPREMWVFGPQIEPILVRYTQLRYRLLPYLYSAASQVSGEGASLMRPLAMDHADARSVATGDQFLLGPSLMACPVTTSMHDGVIIPSERLIDRDGLTNALSGSYFAGVGFDELRHTRRDATVHFAWDSVRRVAAADDRHRDPVPGLPSQHFSVRWEGFIQPNETGVHRFIVRADDGMRLWVDGRLVIDDWRARPAAVMSAEVELPAGARVPIRLEYFQDTHDAVVELRWQTPSQRATPFTRLTWLPPGRWFDFWTGEAIEGGREHDAPAPLETMPLFVRAGAIVPLGPAVQHAMEPADPIELRVYRGADGAFTLYEDDGVSYAYEQGESATIPLTWDQTRGVLTIGPRQGGFEGMLRERTFHVVFVGPGEGVGIEPAATPDAIVRYGGDAMDVPAPR